MLFTNGEISVILVIYTVNSSKGGEDMQQENNARPGTADPASERKIPLSFTLFLSVLSAVLCGVSPYILTRAGLIVLLFFAAAGAAASFVFYTSGKPYVFLYVLPAYGLAFLITRSPFDAALSLLALPLSVAHIICLSRKKGKTQTVAVMTAAFAAVLLIIFAADYMAAYGNIDIGRLIAAAQELLRAQYDNANEIYLQMTGEVAYSENVITATVAAFITRLPAMYILICMCTAYLSLLGFSVLLRHTGLYRVCFPEGYVFRASFASAVVYLIFYFISLFFSEDLYSVPGVVSGNITTVLTPLMAIIGAKAAGRWLKRSFAGSAGCLIFLLLPLLFFLQSGGLIIALLSAIGVISVIGGRIFAALKKKQ